MINFISFALVAVLQLAHVANAGFNTIWVDDMDSYSYNYWDLSEYSYLDFSNSTFPWIGSYDEIVDKCVTGTCAMQWAGFTEDQELERYTTWDGEYETLRFSFDLVLSNMESGNSCQVWYRLDDDSWVILNSFTPETSDVNEKYYGQTFDIAASGASALMIQLYADGDDDQYEYDACFWDNLELSGQRPITSEPSMASAAPSVMPTGSPTNSSAMPTTSPTMAAPQTTMYTSTVVAGDDDDSGDDDDDDHSSHDHDDDMGAVSRFSTKIGLFLGVVLCVLQLAR